MGSISVQYKPVCAWWTAIHCFVTTDCNLLSAAAGVTSCSLYRAVCCLARLVGNEFCVVMMQFSLIIFARVGSQTLWALYSAVHVQRQEDPATLTLHLQAWPERLQGVHASTCMLQSCTKHSSLSSVSSTILPSARSADNCCTSAMPCFAGSVTQQWRVCQMTSTRVTRLLAAPTLQPAPTTPCSWGSSSSLTGTCSTGALFKYS